LFGLNLFGRRAKEPPEMSLATMRSLLEVREEMRRAREKPRETLSELMRLGNRELRPGDRQAAEDAAVTGTTPFFEPQSAEAAALEAAEVEAAAAAISDDASFVELNNDDLIRLLHESHKETPAGNEEPLPPISMLKPPATESPSPLQPIAAMPEPEPSILHRFALDLPVKPTPPPPAVEAAPDNEAADDDAELRAFEAELQAFEAELRAISPPADLSGTPASLPQEDVPYLPLPKTAKPVESQY
jgi:hypothetical protein